MLNTVIVIDDSEADRYLARRALKKSGVVERVFEVASAVDALELLSNQAKLEATCGPWPPPVVLLLDINMPRMSGFEFLDEVALRVERDEIAADCFAAVMYTSSDDQRDIERSIRHRFVVDYVTKPVTTEAILRIAERVAAIQT